MLTMKKVQALAETILWIIAVIVMICVVLPIGAGLTLAGFVFRMFHVDLVSDAAAWVMDMLVVFVKFVTRRIRMRTREIEALRTRG